MKELKEIRKRKDSIENIYEFLYIELNYIAVLLNSKISFEEIHNKVKEFYCIFSSDRWFLNFLVTCEERGQWSNSYDK